MKIIKVVLAVFVITVSLYGLITQEFSNSPIPSLLLGIFIGVLGIEEFITKGKNSSGMFLIPLSLLIIAMALISF